MSEKGDLKVWIAVNCYGEGFVIGWDGDQTDGGDNMMSTYEAFIEEISDRSCLTDDLGFPYPKKPGIYLFTGKMTWMPGARWESGGWEEAEPVYTGNFECLLDFPYLDCGVDNE